MSQVCKKFCTPNEIDQIKNTYQSEPTININGIKYCEKKGDINIKTVIRSNTRSEYVGIKNSGIEGSTKFQGDVGENHAFIFAQEILGFKPVTFDKKETGFDGIYKDKSGKFIILEVKFTDSKNGIGSLHEEKGLTQMSISWVLNRLEKMNGNDSKGSDLFTTRNTAVANDIKKAYFEGSLRRVLIHTHPETLNVVISEKDQYDIWQQTRAFMFDSFEK